MAYAAPVPSSPPVASANYANSAGTASYANSAGTANNANNANYANTAGYANSSGLPAYSQWKNATQYYGETGYIYLYSIVTYHDYSTADGGCTSAAHIDYSTYYEGIYSDNVEFCDGSIMSLVAILANN